MRASARGETGEAVEGCSSVASMVAHAQIATIAPSRIPDRRLPASAQRAAGASASCRHTYQTRTYTCLQSTAMNSQPGTNYGTQGASGTTGAFMAAPRQEMEYLCAGMHLL